VTKLAKPFDGYGESVMPTSLSRLKLWSIGGGKGGIGKSLVTLGLGIALARLGKKVILIDGDLGGANLHTLMGVRYPHVTLEHFLTKKVTRLEDTVIETAVEGIGLICGADDLMGAANPTFAQKIRLLHQIEELPAQYVLFDQGAGTSFNTLDFFNFSGGKIALFTSQTTSLQNAYGFIKSALYRKLSRDFAKDIEILELLYRGGEAENVNHCATIQDLLDHFKDINPEKHARLTSALRDFHLFLVVNMVKNNADLKAPEIIRSVCRDFLNIQPDIMGQVLFDSGVEAAISRMVPFPLHQKKSKAMVGLNQIALQLVRQSRLPRGGWSGVQEAVEEEALPLDAIITHPSTS
jgi:flagellar biosynthesis protein FlhG